MNHSNLKIIVHHKNQHPYGRKDRLQFFAHKAGKTLHLIDSTKQLTHYAIINQ